MADPESEQHGRHAARLPWWQPWAALGLFAFLLNFAWEVLQAPFYSGMAEEAHRAATLRCLLAALGDVALVLAAYGLVALGIRSRNWIAHPTLGRVATFVVAGIAGTAAFELANVHWWGRWFYAPRMPTVLGIGFLPLLQWLLLPPAALWLTRRDLGWNTHHIPKQEAGS